MKKNLFILAVAGLALASCSSDETIASQATSQANEISFRPFVAGTTRAADQSFTQATNGKTFKVTAFQTGAETNKYIDGVVYTSNGTSFNSAQPYYWPSSYNLDFFAYTPNDGASGQISEVTTDNPAIGYKKFTVIPSTTVSSQADLVFANTDNWGKYTTGTTAGHVIPTATGVTINFRHAGAKIRVKVKNTNQTLKFDVSGWKLANVDGSAVYSYSGCTGDATNTDGQGTNQLKYADWSENNDAQTVDYSTTFATANVISANETTDKFLNSSSSTTASATTDESLNMILIPQITTAVPVTDGYDAKSVDSPISSGSYLALKMVIKNSTNDGVVADATTEGKWAIWPVAFNWVPGKCYTYTIDLAGGGYWEANIDGSDTDDRNLDPILEGAEIKFVTVTVDSWSDFDNDTSADGIQPIDVTMP